MVGEQISHYRLESKLGSGTYGVVYKGAHVDDPELQVAVKVVQPSLLDDPKFVDSLKAECRRLDKLDHSGIVRFRELVVREGQVAMVLELLEGKDLHDTIQEGPLPIAEAQEIIEAVLSALAYAHSKEVIHRDIKPSNIFLCDDGRVKILDFGIARAAQNTQATQTGTMKGTLDYMAPERFSAGGGGPHSDVYAVGLVAWELVAGRTACPEGDLPEKLGWHLGVGPLDLKTVRPDCPEWLAGLVTRMANRDLQIRPADGAAALADLQTARASAVDTSAPVDPSAPRLAPGTVSVQREAVAEALREIANTPPRQEAEAAKIAPPPAVETPVVDPPAPVSSTPVVPPPADPVVEAPAPSPPPPAAAKPSGGLNMGVVVALVLGAVVLGGGLVAVLALGFFTMQETDAPVATSSATAQRATAVKRKPDKPSSARDAPAKPSRSASRSPAATPPSSAPRYGSAFAGESPLVVKAAQGFSLSYSDLSGASCETLWRVRNWTFARHGRKFTTPRGKRYFNSHGGYTRNPYYSDGDCNSTDKATMKLAKRLERDRGC